MDRFRIKFAVTWRWAAALLALPMLLVLAPAPAKADFRVCNATQNLVGVAIGYRATDGWKTEGWWQIDGSTCKTLIEGSLSSRYYYLYAEDAERGGRWDGPVNMCIAKEPFKIVGVADCFARGFERAGFREYDTGEQASWMVQLTDDPGGGETSEAAPAPSAADATPEADAEVDPGADPQAGDDAAQAPDAGASDSGGAAEGDAPAEGSGD